MAAIKIIDNDRIEWINDIHYVTQISPRDDKEWKDISYDSDSESELVWINFPHWLKERVTENGYSDGNIISYRKHPFTHNDGYDYDAIFVLVTYKDWTEEVHNFRTGSAFLMEGGKTIDRF